MAEAGNQLAFLVTGAYGKPVSKQQGAPLRLAELQVLAELVRERRATTAELAALVQRTEAETRAKYDRKCPDKAVSSRHAQSTPWQRAGAC